MRQKLNPSSVALLAEDVVVERVAPVALGPRGKEKATVLAFVALDVEASVQGNHPNCFFKAWEKINGIIQ